MADREKVIKGLEACLDEADCTKCYKDGPGFGYACRESLMRDALVALKEQEAVEPREQEETRTWIVCGNCFQHLISRWLWCPYCGRKVKWRG